ncbi:MAG: response regulator [Pirellulaceae bacterium]
MVQTQQQRVLVVDDSPLNRQLMIDALAPEYEVATAENGEQCLSRLAEFEPDVVLLDILMPGIDGYETCRRIKAGPYGAFTQVVMVSSRESTDSRLEGYKAFTDDYITKPFHAEELRWKVRVQFRLRNAHLDLWKANSRIREYSEHLERLVIERTAEVVATQDVAVLALAQLAESRDAETGLHLSRMRSYSQLIAEQLGRRGRYAHDIDAEFLDTLYRSSPLHDIGKVGVPDAILQKPGPLTEQEREIMQQHVRIGAETLERAAQMSGGGQFLRMAAEICRYHHEWYDGAGYLAGIAGEEIPLSARIVAVADVYDALTSKRVYKSAQSPEEAREIIDEKSGVHFDPVVVEAFHHRFDDFRTVPEYVTATHQVAGDSVCC